MSTKEYQFQKCKIGLGHRRLAILDLSDAGIQPMEKHDLSIVFNGEVYNFNEIKKELISIGYKFKTTTDTEVLLSAINAWGISAIEKFNGMFAFILYDKKNHRVYFVRDRAGVKPLFLYNNGSVILAASELKAFHKHPKFKNNIDSNAVANYLSYGYVPTNDCIYKNVIKIKPGTYLEYDLSTKNLEETKYWDVKQFYAKKKFQKAEKEIVNDLEQILLKAFKYRMISDRPIGVFLSGGYDSTTVAALIQKNQTKKINTFTIGFGDKDHNEAPYAKEIAKYLGTDHNELYCTENECLNLIHDIPHFFDEPFGDSSAIPTMLVSRFAKQSVDVALSADAGDETFGGYERYTKAINFYNKTSLIPSPLITSKLLNNSNLVNQNISNKIKRLQYLFRSTDRNLLDYSHVLQLHLLPENVKRIIGLDNTNLNTAFSLGKMPINKYDSLLAIDYLTYLVDDILVKVDRASMSCSLESRDPLLDHHIIEYTARIPFNLKIKKGNKKYILKKLTNKYVPNYLLDRPKKGFSIPLSSWLRTSLSDLLTENINAFNLKNYEFIKPTEIQLLQKRFLEGDDTLASTMWNILTYTLWHKKWQQ